MNKEIPDVIRSAGLQHENLIRWILAQSIRKHATCGSTSYDYVVILLCHLVLLSFFCWLALTDNGPIPVYTESLCPRFPQIRF